ncbi:MAG TPA: hypothetical protein VN618_05520 [Solirubrobacteraceae bacterium]|nr:hypothetical protein [Solirubrobacteraceae bacterium]
MRTDPTENGGLFVGRRPGTAPVHYRDTPERKGELRQRVDGSLASGLFAGMVFVSILCWGPIPVACLWIGSEANYLSGSVGLGILLAFAALFALLFGALALLKRMDNTWILVRRAAGYDQRSGVMGKIFGTTAAICAVVFAFWFVVIHGPGSSIVSGGSSNI